MASRNASAATKITKRSGPVIGLIYVASALLDHAAVPCGASSMSALSQKQTCTQPGGSAKGQSRHMRTISDVIEGGLERALQMRRTFQRRIAQQRHEPSAEVPDSPECA